MLVEDPPAAGLNPCGAGVPGGGRISYNMMEHTQSYDVVRVTSERGRTVSSGAAIARGCARIRLGGASGARDEPPPAPAPSQQLPPVLAAARRDVLCQSTG